MAENASPQVHQPASRAEVTQRAAAAGKAAADRGRAAATPEAAVEAALTVAAERAAAKAEGATEPVAQVEPVAQHTDKPDAKEPEKPGASTEPEAKPDLAVRLRAKQRAREQKLQAEQRAFEQKQQQFQAEQAARQGERERQAYLAKLKDENPTQWLEEVGMTPEIHKKYIEKKLAEQTPQGAALKAETEAQRALRELAELKASIANDKQTIAAAQAEQRFVEAAKAEEYPVIAAMYGDSPFTLVQQGLWAQEQFKREHNRFATNEELLFNIECIEAAKVARATGNEKLAKAVQRTRETEDLKHLREAFGKPKPADAKVEKPSGKKSPPGPGAQSRTSVAAEEQKPLSQKERRERAAAASREAREKLARGETKVDVEYASSR